jgi:hypothetical protein
MWAMPHRTAGLVLLCSSLAALTACHVHPPVESRVKSVEARIDGITCPTCVPPLTNSLKRQWAQSAVDVNDDKDTATIQFAGNEDFSAPQFRAAVERVRMRVIRVRLQACGTVETANGNKVLTAGSNRFVLRSDGELPPDEPICADGTLDSERDPATFHISAFTRQGTEQQ